MLNIMLGKFITDNSHGYRDIQALLDTPHGKLHMNIRQFRELFRYATYFISHYKTDGELKF
jgi:hypothetical protein